MKIGIDARLYESAGPGRYVSNLIAELEKTDDKNDYIIFVSKEGSELYHPTKENFKKWIVTAKEYSFTEQLILPFHFLRADLDLLHVPHFNIPILYPRKMVVTIHDLIMHQHNPEASLQDGMMYTFKRFMYVLVTNIAGLRAQKIIAPSEKVKSDVVDKLRFVDKDKVVVTYEGVDNRLMKLDAKDDRVIRTRLEEMHIRKRYFLFVGSAYPHKNLDALIVSYKEAFERKQFEGQLVIAGKVDMFSQKAAGFVHALKMDDLIIFAAKYTEKNMITDKDLAYLYRGALAYVFPSLEEGFSITPLEAQAFSVPVLLSDISTHKEIFKNSVLYFDPKSSIDLSNKMEQIANDIELREELIARGSENVKRFSWSLMAKQTLEVYGNLGHTKDKI